jgi:hypothetical protein
MKDKDFLKNYNTIFFNAVHIITCKNEKVMELTLKEETNEEVISSQSTNIVRNSSENSGINFTMYMYVERG